MLKGRLLPAIAASLLIAVTGAALPAGAADNAGQPEADSVVAALTSVPERAGRQASIPAILSESDATLYRTAVAYQARGQWAAADHEIAKFTDPLLVGHLLADRYLSGAYHGSPAELREWLTRYADLPEAEAVYEEARAAQNGRTAGLKPPAHGEDLTQAAQPADDADSLDDFAAEGGRKAVKAHAGAARSRIRALLSDDRLDDAAALLEHEDRGQDRAEIDSLKARLGAAYFHAGRDQEADRWAGEAADRSGDILPEAHWIAGLAEWRIGDKARSEHHFEAVANAADTSPWLVAAGAYWAGRASLAARKPETVNHWLRLAAAYPRTFYGLLARRALGEDVQYSWEAGPFTDVDAAQLERVPGARRALALLQIGDRARAEEELRYLAGEAGPGLAQSMLALAHAADMPTLAVQLGAVESARDGRTHDSAAFPLPEWHPSGGFKIDRALLLAIARQESSFNPRAKSPCGAVGLMQLMPRTARTLGAAGRLTDPQVSLELGQRYVRRLLDDDSIKGNLLFLAASYNSGPGNVARWTQSIHHDGDALMFLESIPVHETRAFVEHVLTNFWAYRNRLGQTTPSLDAMAAGEWPIYDAPSRVAKAGRHAEN